VIFTGTNPNITSSSVTINGHSASTATLVQTLEAYNNPGRLVLFNTGAFAYVPTTPNVRGVNYPFPIVGTYFTASNHWIHLNGTVNTVHNTTTAGTSTQTAYVSGFIVPISGKFYAFLNYAATDVTPVNATSHNVEIDFASFVLALTF
jgi:hypothetical protein